MGAEWLCDAQSIRGGCGGSYGLVQALGWEGEAWPAVAPYCVCMVLRNRPIWSSSILSLVTDGVSLENMAILHEIQVYLSGPVSDGQLFHVVLSPCCLFLGRPFQM